MGMSFYYVIKNTIRILKVVLRLPRFKVIEILTVKLLTKALLLKL